jgi:hypothetical protein
MIAPGGCATQGLSVAIEHQVLEPASDRAGQGRTSADKRGQGRNLGLGTAMPDSRTSGTELVQSLYRVVPDFWGPGY